MNYAVALDIGTTNIQASLLDLEKKKELDYINTPNSLSKYGKDIITRFSLTFAKKDARRDIQEIILRDINRIIERFIEKTGIKNDEISIIAACGNTAMHHALLGLSFETLLRSPFKPSHSRALFVESASKVGIGIKNKQTKFMFLPNIDGFVGSDAFCVVIATRIYKKKDLQLAIDMGTNGEIIMGNSSRILAASTSAGPAFEIRTTYGTEIIDAVVSLLKKGIIDKTGFMKKGKPSIYGVGRERISISQDDIRKLQLAKAAISGGIKVLKEKFPHLRLNNVFITGLFGTRINKANAKRIGIIPKEIDKVVVLDKAALRGLKEVLYNPGKEGDFLGLLAKIEHVELHREKSFFPSFTESLIF